MWLYQGKEEEKNSLNLSYLQLTEAFRGTPSQPERLYQGESLRRILYKIKT